MRVFLHEFITSGALAGQSLPPSLLREGEAMRKAVISDLLRIPDVTVITTRDNRVLPLELSGLTEFSVLSAPFETELFGSFCAEADRCLVIAPEIDGELGRRVDIAMNCDGRGRVLNSPELIAAASDKWETFLRLKRAKVPTIETCLGDSDDWRAWDRPIAKPRDGAGSQGVKRISGAECGDFRASDRWVIQPYIRGRWLCCTVFFRADGSIEVFPPAEQHISDDGGFAYLGGAMPVECDVDRVQSLAVQAIRAIERDHSELVGPVGVDLVEDCATGELFVCEINPRFTTSYVAARELADANLLVGLLRLDVPPLKWRSDRVEFDAAGHIRFPNR